MISVGRASRPTAPAGGASPREPPYRLERALGHLHLVAGHRAQREEVDAAARAVVEGVEPPVVESG